MTSLVVLLRQLLPILSGTAALAPRLVTSAVRSHLQAAAIVFVLLLTKRAREVVVQRASCAAPLDKHAKFRRAPV